MATGMHAGAPDSARMLGDRGSSPVPRPRGASLAPFYPRHLPSLKTLVLLLERRLGRPDQGVQSTTDEMLVQELARGDRSALARLYTCYADVFRGLAALLLGDAADAEDLLHDVFLESWQKAASFDPARGNVRIWLLVRLRSRALDRLGSSHRKRLVPLTEDAPANTIGSAHLVSTEQPTSPYLASVVRSRCALLPTPHRELLLLMYVKDLTVAEIATELRVPIGTIKSRLNRVLSTLRREESY